MNADPASPANLRLLHLEDNLADAELILLQITAEWPGCEIHRVDTRHDFLTALQRGGFDLILSDFSLPNFNGLEALTLARQYATDTPFIFLSGTIGEDNAVQALKSGAADYIIKDRPKRFVAAIRQALAHVQETVRRRDSEAQVREQATLLDKARDAIIATDLEHRITYWNARAEEIYGWPAEEAVNHRLEELHLHADPGRFASARAKLNASGEWRGEFIIQSRDGRTLQVESTWSLVMGADGRPRSILFIDTDVTERRRMEAQIHRAERMESIGMLAGGVAHDLNNALAPILMAAELLRAHVTDPEDRRFVDSIEASAQHGAALVQQLLTFARGSEGQRTSVDIPHLLADVQKLLGTTLAKDIDLSVETVGEPWPILAEVTKVKQVLINLCLNARDAMPEGGRIEILAGNTTIGGRHVLSQPGAQPGSYLRIAVRDTGTGIPPDVLGRIFDPFFTTKPAGKGTGLGLSMVAGIIKSHGGWINVESHMGQGTLFELYFPVRDPAPGTPSGSAAPSVTKGRGESILLVDDDPAVCDVFKAVLEHAGYGVVAVGTGPATLAEFDRRPGAFAVVITDIMMPGMNGGEVIRALRARSPRQPLLAISGLMDPEKLAGLRDLNPPVECLAKPILPEKLLLTLRRIIDTAARPA
ncbi:MAG: response regulator [Verrucomicrobia bacterium]|nr:response regulator [Verrucomicrobiota bacterium]